ncbi:AAA family ATPase [Sorangium sp. So ce726]|uniref:AAA family ATPase n=1 Tax=Sorangium sp. So ce726 TaxID=3133319 RepID=UPI003F60466F
MSYDITDVIGRERERALFRMALDGTGARAFYVYGPGGVGKTTLLQMFARDARHRSVRIEQIDCRNIEPTLQDVVTAIEHAGLFTSSCDTTGLPQLVVAVDSYEYIQAIDPRLCCELVRRLRGGNLLVLAGRTPPSVEWRSQPLWRTGIVPIALRNLNSADSRTFLMRRGIKDQAISTIVAFSHGHPLALALAAEAWTDTPDSPFAPESAPQVIAALYEYFLRGISEPERRAALDLTAVLRTTSEKSLCALLECDAVSTFAWLRQLSFMQIDNSGVFPHDLAREVILADMRWRNHERLSAMIMRALSYYLDHWRARAGIEVVQILPEFYFLTGHYPQLDCMRVPPDAGLAMDNLRPGDEQALQEAVQRHEGPTSLQYLRHWILHQPAAFMVVRSAENAIAGFGAWIRIDLTTDKQRAEDPAIVAAWDYAIRLLGGVPCEPIHYVRFMMSCSVGQAVSREMSLCVQNTGRKMLSNWGPLLFFCMSDRRAWEGVWAVSDTHVVPELQHELDGVIREVLLQDLRGLSFVDVMASVTERCAMGACHEQNPKPAHVEDSSLAAISMEEFGVHVREALRTLHDTLALARNPLLHSQIVRTRVASNTSPRDRVRALQSLLIGESEAIRGSRRGNAWYRVLKATYLEPVGKHESAAEELGMSYSTFRRRLAEATQHLVSALWELELSCATEA